MCYKHIKWESEKIKITKGDKIKLSKYKNCLPALVNQKISFKNKRKLLILKGGLKVLFCQYFVRYYRITNKLQ
jgi:hypothetical protein